jgi:pilus assembly protein Flp/PilA
MTCQRWDGADETGATAVEYGFLASLIAVVIIVAVSFVGERLRVIFDSILSWF